MSESRADEIRAAALRVFRTTQGADAFMNLHCRPLGGKPVDLVEAGREIEVLQFLDELERKTPAPPRTLAGIFGGWMGSRGR